MFLLTFLCIALLFSLPFADFKFVVYPPSMVAAASVSAAAVGLLGESKCRHLMLMDHLRDVTSIDSVSQSKQLVLWAFNETCVRASDLEP